MVDVFEVPLDRSPICETRREYCIDTFVSGALDVGSFSTDFTTEKSKPAQKQKKTAKHEGLILFLA
jgi:hypothetical protein